MADKPSGLNAAAHEFEAPAAVIAGATANHTHTFLPAGSINTQQQQRQQQQQQQQQVNFLHI